MIFEIKNLPRLALLWISWVCLLLEPVSSLRYVVNRKECVTQVLHSGGDLLSGSFVVFRHDSAWIDDSAYIDLEVSSFPGSLALVHQHQVKEGLVMWTFRFMRSRAPTGARCTRPTGRQRMSSRSGAQGEACTPSACSTTPTPPRRWTCTSGCNLIPPCSPRWRTCSFPVSSQRTGPWRTR